MLAIISDLHLQDTAFDCVRYREGNALKQIGVRRNVKATAFERLIARVLEAARRRRSAEIHLVFAGDIFELHRAPGWFLGPNNQARPTDFPVGEDIEANPLRGKVVEILDRLKDDPDHAEFWQAIREFVLRPPADCPGVTVHYLPGNHDRLANAWPTVRRRVRWMLGMDETVGAPFPVRLDFTGPPLGEYGVRIRHGHEYDPPNFSGSTKTGTALDLDWEAYLKPAFGDYITVDVAMRLALAFRARYAAAMRGAVDPKEKLPTPAKLRELYLALTEFDDVRPASLLTDYLAKRMGSDRAEAFKALKPILRDVVETAVADRLFMAQASKHVPKLLLKLLPELVKNLSPAMLEEVVRKFSKSSGDDTDTPGRRALGEFAPGGGFNLVVTGHTHRPEQVPLAGGHAPKDALYLNSGTWRTTLPYGVGDFGRLRAYTMIFCYNKVEQEAGPDDGRTFEAWTGHLAAGKLGPYDETVNVHSPAPAGVMQLVFESLEAIAVEKELNGAELRVHFGVDDQVRKAEFEKVRAGADRLSITQPPLPLDPDLDGDLWFYGVEVDWGTNPLDYDDPLPWALEPLPRESIRGQFQAGSYDLRILGRGVGGVDRTEFVLHYRIERALT
jgi:UDP-2,3-diacylglucosamine pyrophosphatase LpxH